MNRYWCALDALRRRLGDLRLVKQDGQTTVDYAVATTFVIIVAVASFAALQSSILGFFATLGSKLAAAAAAI
jgi:Flp pilus assembly pilin Flp